MALDDLLSALQTVGEDARSGVLVTDARFRIVYVNPALANMLQRPSGALVGRPLSELGAVWQAGGAPQGAPTVRYRRADGSELRAETQTRVLRGADGTVTGRVARLRPLKADDPAATVQPTGDPAAGVQPTWAPAMGVRPAREIERLRRNNILGALQQADHKITGPGGAAHLLGLPPSTLRSQMRALGIERQPPRALERAR